MIHRLVDQNGDWVFGRGHSSYAHGLDAILLNIKTRILSWRGDCFFALREGVDYNNILGYGTKDALELAIKRVLLTSKGVRRIVTFTLALKNQNRQVSIKAVIDTTYGQGKIEV